MENEKAKTTAEQGEKDGKESGFGWCMDCCEGMSFSDKMKKDMKKEMMGFCRDMGAGDEGKKDMKDPFVMFKKFAGCCAPSDAKKV